MEIKIRTFETGVEEAVRELQRKGSHVLRAAKAELKKGSDDIVKEAKRRVPVDTGTLQSSIKTTSEKDGAVQEITASAIGKNGVDYSRYVEFDPRINKALDPRVKKKDTDPKLKRQLKKGNTAYMYPSLKHNLKKIRTAIYNAVVKACGKW